MISRPCCSVVGGTHAPIVGAGIIGCWIGVIDASVVCGANPSVARSDSRWWIIGLSIACSAAGAQTQCRGAQKGCEEDVQEFFHREVLVKGKILSEAFTLSCFLPDVFQHGLEGNLLKRLGLFEGEERVAEPGMQVPPRKIDELARTVRLISKGGD
jgi:hypothetical protein